MLSRCKHRASISDHIEILHLDIHIQLYIQKYTQSYYNDINTELLYQLYVYLDIIALCGQIYQLYVYIQIQFIYVYIQVYLDIHIELYIWINMAISLSSPPWGVLGGLRVGGGSGRSPPGEPPPPRWPRVLTPERDPLLTSEGLSLH